MFERYTKRMVNSIRPKDGLVLGAETAMRIAEAVWIPIFGHEEVERQRPFQMDLEYSIWVVMGRPKNHRKGQRCSSKSRRAMEAILLVGQAR